MSNAHWGYWDSLEDDTVHGRRGALSSKSKNLGDGGWCAFCLSNHFYQWIDHKFYQLIDYKEFCCPKCGIYPVEITNKDTL